MLCIALPAYAARITDVVDTGSVVLDDGRTVALAGIWMPPTAAPSLKALLVGQVVTLSHETTDRHGMPHAILTLPDSSILQSMLLAKGAAQVLPNGVPADVLNGLYGAELGPRTARAGLWGSADNGLHTPASVVQRIGHFAIVQGTVHEVATVKGTTYVNFGDDWRTDFTLAMPSGLARTLKAKDWAGRDVRARGWVQNYNGPLISITETSQVEPLFAITMAKKAKRAPRDRATKPRPRQRS